MNFYFTFAWSTKLFIVEHFRNRTSFFSTNPFILWSRIDVGAKPTVDHVFNALTEMFRYFSDVLCILLIEIKTFSPKIIRHLCIKHHVLYIFTLFFLSGNVQKLLSYFKIFNLVCGETCYFSFKKLFAINISMVIVIIFVYIHQYFKNWKLANEKFFQGMESCLKNLILSIGLKIKT